MITTITLNPAVDKTICVDSIKLNDSNRIVSVETDAGGKGISCSRMAKNLGGETQVIALLGGQTGDYIESVLNGQCVPLTRIHTQAQTRTCIAIEECANVPPTTFNERGGPVTESELASLLAAVESAAAESDYLVMGGSVPNGVPVEIYCLIAEIATLNGARAVIDADGPPLTCALETRPFMIKPNLDEARRLLGRELSTLDEVVGAARELGKRIELAIISMGKDGAVAAYHDEVYAVSSPEVKTVSTIGSGDSMIAGILVGLERGLDIADALRLGAAAGASTAMSDGTDIGTRENAEKLMAEAVVRQLQRD